MTHSSLPRQRHTQPIRAQGACKAAPANQHSEPQSHDLLVFRIALLVSQEKKGLLTMLTTLRMLTKLRVIRVIWLQVWMGDKEDVKNVFLVSDRCCWGPHPLLTDGCFCFTMNVILHLSSNHLSPGSPVLHIEEDWWVSNQGGSPPVLNLFIRCFRFVVLSLQWTGLVLLKIPWVCCLLFSSPPVVLFLLDLVVDPDSYWILLLFWWRSLMKVQFGSHKL